MCRLRIQNGCAIIWMSVRSIILLTHRERVFRTCSTHYRKRSKRRRNNSRRHMQSRCMTSLCTTEVPTPSSLRPKRPVLRGRFPRKRLLVLTHSPTKHTAQTSPTKPALWGRLLLNRLRRPSLPPTKRTRQREFPGKTWYTSLVNEIQLRHYAPKTLKAYTQWVRHFQTCTRSQDPEWLSSADVKEFLTFLAVTKKVSASTQNQAFHALLFRVHFD
jgi:hypothetical protein